MKNRFINSAGILLIVSLILTGCGFGAQATQPAEDPGMFYTQAAQTMSAAMTLNAAAIEEEQPTNTPLPPPTDTPMPEPTMAPPTETPTAEVEIVTLAPTETPAPETPMLHVTENTNCRAGPGPMYGVEGYVTTDMNLSVVGINEGRSWWWVDNPTYPGFHCWVNKYTSVVDGDTSLVPVYRDPWTMTPADPEIEVSTNIYPRSYVGKCPATVTVVATIRTNRSGQFHYKFLRGKNHTKYSDGWVNIAADGSAIVSTTVNVKYDATNFFIFRVDYPVRYETTRIGYTVDCKNN